MLKHQKRRFPARAVVDLLEVGGTESDFDALVAACKRVEPRLTAEEERAMEIYIRWGKRTRADCAAELHKRLRTIAVPLHSEMQLGGVRRSRAACGQARKALQDGAKRGLEPLLTGLTECLKVSAGRRLHSARPARAEGRC